MQFTTKNLALLAAAASLTNALPTVKHTKRSFDIGSSSNVAAYWGNTDGVKTSIADICNDKITDIVILTFAQYEASNKTWSVVATKEATTDDVKNCQKNGKKVFMSLEGGNVNGHGNTIFTSDDDAKAAADAAFTEYLTDQGALKVALDGIDLDVENKQPAHWDTFATELKSKKTKDQLISVAPQCPMPDASIPDGAISAADLVWVQFYNNPDCGHNSADFYNSVGNWSAKVGNNAKFYIAIQADTQSASAVGYVDPKNVPTEINKVKAMNLKNFGGYTLWDAGLAKQNSDYGSVIKNALTSTSSSKGQSSSKAVSNAASNSTVKAEAASKDASGAASDNASDSINPGWGGGEICDNIEGCGGPFLDTLIDTPATTTKGHSSGKATATPSASHSHKANTSGVAHQTGAPTRPATAPHSTKPTTVAQQTTFATTTTHQPISFTFLPLIDTTNEGADDDNSN